MLITNYIHMKDKFKRKNNINICYFILYLITRIFKFNINYIIDYIIDKPPNYWGKIYKWNVYD